METTSTKIIVCVRCGNLKEICYCFCPYCGKNSEICKCYDKELDLEDNVISLYDLDLKSNLGFLTTDVKIENKTIYDTEKSEKGQIGRTNFFQF